MVPKIYNDKIYGLRYFRIYDIQLTIIYSRRSQLQQQINLLWSFIDNGCFGIIISENIK